MPSFVQNASTTATAYTLAGGEVGFVGENATLTLNADLITMTGASDLVVRGDIFSSGGNAVDGLAAGTFVNVYVGDGGSIGSSGLAIDVASGVIVNHGEIYNTSGTNTIVGRTGALDVVNYGTISRGNVDGFAIGYSGTSSVRYLNYGTIDGSIGVDSSTTAFNVVNSGTISGRIVDFGNAAAIVRNTGLVTGAIELNGGADFFDGAGGRVLGQVLGGAGNDTLLGGDFDDLFSGGADNDQLTGRAGADTLNGEAGNDTIYGGDHNDFIAGGSGNDYIDGQGEDDTLYGGDNNDTIFGNAGNDYIDGQGENDVIDGGAGNDTIQGNIGQDQISGGTGFDRLSGGLGDDQFRFYGGDFEQGGRDVIADFAEAGGNADLLVFFDGITAANVTTFAQGPDTLVRVTLNGGTLVHEILVENFTPGQLADQIFFL